MHNEIPTSRPQTPLLDSIDSPADLRALDEKQLPQLADELRAFLLYSVGQTGGHFGAGLGVVELTIALHYVYQTPADRLVWDVGHQTYPHKILTSRRERMHSIRQGDGLSGFPKREESDNDTFDVGHSSWRSFKMKASQYVLTFLFVDCCIPLSPSISCLDRFTP